MTLAGTLDFHCVIGECDRSFSTQRLLDRHQVDVHDRTPAEAVSTTPAADAVDEEDTSGLRPEDAGSSPALRSSTGSDSSASSEGEESEPVSTLCANPACAARGKPNGHRGMHAGTTPAKPTKPAKSTAQKSAATTRTASPPTKTGTRAGSKREGTAAPPAPGTADIVHDETLVLDLASRSVTITIGSIAADQLDAIAFVSRKSPERVARALLEASLALEISPLATKIMQLRETGSAS